MQNQFVPVAKTSGNRRREKGNKVRHNCHLKLTYNTTGEDIRMGGRKGGLYWRVLKKVELMLGGLTSTLFKRPEMLSGDPSSNKIWHKLPSWKGVLKSSGRSKKYRRHQMAMEDTERSGNYSIVASKTNQQMSNVEPYNENACGGVYRLEINYSNSSRYGCNRSFPGMPQIQGSSSGRPDNCGTWGQAYSDPSRITNTCDECGSGLQNSVKCPSNSPMKSTIDLSRETDIRKIAASCVRRYTLEESKALATSPPMYTSDFSSSTPKSCENIKPTASCPGEQLSCTSKVLGRKVEGQSEYSQNPIPSPSWGKSVSKMRYNDPILGDSADGQYRMGLQSSSLHRSGKLQTDKLMPTSMETFDDSKDLPNLAYSQSRPPTNESRSCTNRKSGRQSPCRIAITGCERPVVHSYASPEINPKDKFSNGPSEYGVSEDVSKLSSRFLTKHEDGIGYDGTSQRLTEEKMMNRDFYHQSSGYPMSSSSKWNNIPSQDVSRDYPQSTRPQETRNEDQESQYGGESYQKNAGGYSLQVKYTEVEEEDPPFLPDVSDDDRSDEPNQMQVRDRSHQSPNEPLRRPPYKTSSNPQYTSSKHLTETYDPNDGEVDYQNYENINGDSRAYREGYYSTEPRVPTFLQDEISHGRVRCQRRAPEDASPTTMQRSKQNHFMDISRSPPPPHRCLEDMERSPTRMGCTRNFECPRCMSRAHSEEYSTHYPVSKKTSGLRRKRSRKRCVSRRQATQKCSGRPRKVVRLPRRASMELERRYAPQVRRSESSLAYEAPRTNRGTTTKRRYSQPESLRDDNMSGENKKCLCRAPSSRCVVVNPCYRTNRAAFLRKKFNEERIDEEGEPCCCVTLFRSSPVRGNNRSPRHFAESVEEREEGSVADYMNGEKGEREPCYDLKAPNSRNGCQSKERDTEAKKNPDYVSTPCLNIDLEGKQIVVKKIDTTTNCASSEFALSEKRCGKSGTNNDISIALGDKTIIIKNPGVADQLCFETKNGKCTLDSHDYSGSSFMDNAASRHMNTARQRQKPPCKRRCGSPATQKRSTPLKSCSLREAASYEHSTGIKPSVCQPTVCVAFDYIPDIQEPPPRAVINKSCPPIKRAPPKSNAGFCPCTQISNGAMPCSKRPARINSPSTSPQSGSPRTTPLRQWNAPPTQHPAANSNPRSKSPNGCNPSSDGSQWDSRKPPNSSKQTDESGEPSKKTAPTQTNKVDDGKDGDRVEKCTQCTKKRGFFARICDKIKRKCAKLSAQNQTDEDTDEDEDDDCDADDDDRNGGEADVSRCMRVNDTTSCSLRYNDTRSYNCSACSTSRCVSNQSHSFMDITDDGTTNFQPPMRSCNNTASETTSTDPRNKKMQSYFIDCETSVTQPQVKKYFYQKTNLGLLKKELTFGPPGALFGSNHANLNATYLPMLASSHSTDDSPDPTKSSNRGVKKDCDMEDEKSQNSNNFRSKMNTFDCCAKAVGKEVPMVEIQKNASSQCFGQTPIAHFVHEATIKPPHQGTTSAKNASVRLRRLDKPLFQTLNRPHYEVFALFKRPLIKNPSNDSMMYGLQKTTKYLEPRWPLTLGKTGTDPVTIKTKPMDTSGRWGRIYAPHKKTSHAFTNICTGENLQEVDNRKFSATKSTDESAMLSQPNKICGYVEICPIGKQAAVLKPPVKTTSGLDVPLCAKSWSKSMVTFPPPSVRSSSFIMSHGNTLSTKPAFLPRNSAPSLHTHRSHGLMPSIWPKVSPNSAYANSCRSSFESKPVNLAYGSSCANCSKVDNYLIKPPYQCIGSSECRSIHNRPIETTDMKTPIAPESKMECSNLWQRSERPSATKVSGTLFPPRAINPSPLRSSSNSFGFSKPLEVITVQPIKPILQTPTSSLMSNCTSNQCQNDKLLSNTRSGIVSPSLHYRTSVVTSGYEGKKSKDIKPSIATGEKKNEEEKEKEDEEEEEEEEKKRPQYSFQVEGRIFQVKVDKEGVFHVKEMRKPPENSSSVPQSSDNGEKLRSAPNALNSDESKRESQCQASPSSQPEPEASEKSVEVNDASNRGSTSRSKNSPIHDLLKRSIKSLSGKIARKFSNHASQQVGNSHTMTEEEKRSGNNCECFLPLTVSEVSSRTDSKMFGCRTSPTNCPSNQNGHQTILDHWGEIPRKDSSTNSQLLIWDVNVAVGSSYADDSPHSSKKKRVHSTEMSDEISKPIACCHHSNYKSGDCVEKSSSWNDEDDGRGEEFDSYPKTKNSTLFNYVCQMDSETSVGISASLSMGKHDCMDTNTKPVTLNRHVNLMNSLESEEGSTSSCVEVQDSITRSNSVPLCLGQQISPNRSTSEVELSNSDTDNIIETPFKEDCYDLHKGVEAQIQVDFSNWNNTGQEESRINIKSGVYQHESPNFSNQNNYFGSCHEQQLHPQLTTQWSQQLVPPLNNSLVCGDVKTTASVGSRNGKECERSVPKLQVETGKDKSSPLKNDNNDDDATKSVDRRSSSSETEDPSLMSTTLTLLLEGLCGTSGGTMDSRISSPRSERRRGNSKCKKQSHSTSKSSTIGQNKSEGKRIESSCSKFKENKAYLLRKRQNCNHTNVRCVTCLKKQQKQSLDEPKMHFFAKGVLKHPFRKVHRKDTRSTKDSIFKNRFKYSRRSEVRRRRSGHVTKPSGDRCCGSLKRRWRSSSRPRTRSHTSCHTRLASFGTDTDGLGPSTSTECCTFKIVEPLEGIEQPISDLTSRKHNPLNQQSKVVRQWSDLCVTPKRASVNPCNQKHFPSLTSPKPRSVSTSMNEEVDENWEAENLAILSNPNFTFPQLHDVSHASEALSRNSRDRTENQDLTGDCVGNRNTLSVKMRSTLPIWDVKTSTPPLLIVPSSESQSDESSSIVPSPITSLNTSEIEV
ncbi:unnamed protein product [Hydatigera taeniaeformis]|uniref:PH domain-containing protein n=1 Tax=Hydatigena taeniaeformis TaxID=6205 RepID=A0A0R3X2Z7_HYDTA|nr:unnamed protein product [Hydatigera taeniaeformis]